MDLWVCLSLFGQCEKALKVQFEGSNVRAQPVDLNCICAFVFSDKYTEIAIRDGRTKALVNVSQINRKRGSRASVVHCGSVNIANTARISPRSDSHLL